MSCVYKHTFPNGAIYIGKTNMQPEDRWLNGWGYKNSPLMFNAIVKYGWDNVKHEILVDNVDEQTALDIETQEIVKHSTSCTVYNTAQLPPQVLAQENAHYIDTSTPPSPQIQSSYITRYKTYIVPLTTKPVGVRTCPINVYTADGEFIATYPSAKVASQELGVNNGDIISCCKGKKADGKPRYQIKGYIFRYAI